MPVNARYNRTAIVLHWAVAILVISNLVITWFWEHLPDSISGYVANTHKTFGIVVLGLVIMRILWRLAYPPRPLENEGTPGYRRLVRGVHGILYLLILAIPITGWICDSAWKDAAANPINFWGLFQMPRIPWIEHLPPARKAGLDEQFGTIHTGLGYVLYALLAAHVLGALKRQIKDREPVLQRMTLKGAVRD